MKTGAACWIRRIVLVACVVCGSSVMAQTPVPDTVGDDGPGESFDCVGLANLIRLCRDFAIPAQDRAVDAAWSTVILKKLSQSNAYAAWRDCAPADYQRLMLAWQAALQATAVAQANYENEKLTLQRMREALQQWILQYQREGC